MIECIPIRVLPRMINIFFVSSLGPTTVQVMERSMARISLGWLQQCSISGYRCRFGHDIAMLVLLVYSHGRRGLVRRWVDGGRSHRGYRSSSRRWPISRGRGSSGDIPRPGAARRASAASENKGENSEYVGRGSGFRHAATINLDRDVVTRGIAGTLRLIGYRPETLLRPRTLEGPKLFLILLLRTTKIIIV